MSLLSSKLRCCFTSTESVGLLGTGAQDGHLDFHTALEFCCFFGSIQCCFASTETMRLIRDGSPGRPLRLSHTLSHTSRARLSSFTQLRSLTLFFHTAPVLDSLLSHSSGARLSSFTQLRSLTLLFHTAPELDCPLSHSSRARLSSFTQLRSSTLFFHRVRLASFTQLRSSTLRFFHTAPEFFHTAPEARFASFIQLLSFGAPGLRASVNRSDVFMFYYVLFRFICTVLPL